VAVLGYCIGATYAAPIAEIASRSQQAEPTVILFDPLRADVRLLVAEMYKILGRFGPLFSGEEKEQIKARVTERVESASGDVAGTAIALSGLFREISSTGCDRMGLAADRRDEMIALFDSYMSYLSVAAQIDPSRTWRHSVAITSTDYVMGTDQDPSASAARRLIGQEIPLDVTHSDLLRSDSTVKVLLDQIGG
jgi:hypothetical protein